MMKSAHYNSRTAAVAMIVVVGSWGGAVLLGAGGWVIDSELARFDSSIDMARSRCLPARFLLRAGARDTPADSLTYPL